MTCQNMGKTISKRKNYGNFYPYPFELHETSHSEVPWCMPALILKHALVARSVYESERITWWKWKDHLYVLLDVSFYYLCYFDLVQKLLINAFWCYYMYV